MLTPLGEIVRDCWLAIPAHFPTMTLDAYVVMPNHIHGIITIRADINGMPMVDNVTDQGRRGPSRQSLSAAVGSFKASVSRQFNVIRGASQPPVWQRDFYEHIIRNERSLEEIRAYVEGNPAAWHLDTENPYR
ncbi:MAG: transposase [Thermomicrobiales bacterium]